MLALDPYWWSNILSDIEYSLHATFTTAKKISIFLFIYSIFLAIVTILNCLNF
jgi:hypothetical protein